MQKLFLLLLLAAGPALAQPKPGASPTAYPYVVKGKIGTFGAPAKVYLVRGTQTLDSAAVQAGRFELKGTTPQPVTAELVLERQGRLRDHFENRMQVKSPDRQYLFLEPGPVVFTGSDSLRTAKLTGGPLTADFQRLWAATAPTTAKFRTATSQAEFEGMFQQYVQAQRDFIKANPNSWVSLEALQQQGMMGPPKYADVAPLYAALGPTLRGSEPGRQYGAMLDKLKLTAVGTTAPNFSQQTPDGKTVSLADYRGKYVLVDFWASWCGPCRQENPNVRAAYATFKGRNFDILGVSLDQPNGRDRWLKAIADDQLPWTQVSDLKGWQNEVAQRYNVQSIPQNFLIDPSGKIVAANLRGPELQATLARLLK